MTTNHHITPEPWAGNMTAMRERAAMGELIELVRLQSKMVQALAQQNVSTQIQLESLKARLSTLEEERQRG